MADFKYNPDTDEYEYVGNGYEGVPEATVDPDVPSPGLFERTYSNPVQAQNDALAAEQQAEAQAVVANAGDDRPLFAQDAGQFFGDLGKSILNPACSAGHGLRRLGPRLG